MGKEAKPVEVTVIGKTYRVMGESSPLIIRSAQYVNEKINEMQKKKPAMVDVDYMVLTAMNIAADLFAIKEDRDKALEQILEKSERLDDYLSFWRQGGNVLESEDPLYEKIREEITSAEEACEQARQEASQLREENMELKKFIEELQKKLDQKNDQAMQMQLYIPEEK